MLMKVASIHKILLVSMLRRNNQTFDGYSSDVNKQFDSCCRKRFARDLRVCDMTESLRLVFNFTFISTDNIGLQNMLHKS